MNASLELVPIVRTLFRNKVGALLIALQIAVTMTIVVNAIFTIDEREALMARVSGVDEADSFMLTVTVLPVILTTRIPFRKICAKSEHCHQYAM